MNLHLIKPSRLAAIALLCVTAPAWAAEQAATGTTTDTANSAQQTAEPAQAAEPTKAAANEGSVARAAFASAIENREPIDKLTEASSEKVYYFTELRDMAGKEVIHRWEHNGKVMAEIPFSIGGDRWRVYSSKRMLPEWKGEWKASVVDHDGTVLSVNTITLNDIPATENMDAPKDTANHEQPVDNAPGLVETPAEGAAKQQ